MITPSNYLDLDPFETLLLAELRVSAVSSLFRDRELRLVLALLMSICTEPLFGNMGARCL